MTTFLIIILVIVSSNISYSQSQDSLLQVKTAHVQYLDSLIKSFNPQEREDFLTYTAKTDNYNTHLFRVINYNRSKFKDDILPGFSKSVFPMAILVPLSTFTYGRIYNKTFDENTGYLLAASEVTNFILTYSAKLLLKEPRPYEVLVGTNKYTNLPLDPFAFPSAHTSFAFTLATTFALRYSKYPQVYVPMYIWGILVAYSRPYLGVHYPVDVLGGMVIAAVSSVLTYSLRSPLLKFKNHLFAENKQNEGSIKGGVVTIFAASLLVSELLTAYVLPDSPLLVSIMPSSKDNRGVNLALNYRF
ncbi:MAG: phosphatase PAP2 family protein [Ignavibacteria bacterium]|jgi:undecaprenyl-diphosphatase